MVTEMLCTCDQSGPDPLCILHGDPRETSMIDAAIERGKTLLCTCGHHWSHHMHLVRQVPATTACTATHSCTCLKFEAEKVSTS